MRYSITLSQNPELTKEDPSSFSKEGHAFKLKVVKQVFSTQTCAEVPVWKVDTHRVDCEDVRFLS